MIVQHSYGIFYYTRVVYLGVELPRGVTRMDGVQVAQEFSEENLFNNAFLSMKVTTHFITNALLS